ncbi:MAG: P-loop ATPase, Sll1717 family [Candidatus Nitrospinota bacterium M3_3B_026]
MRTEGSTNNGIVFSEENIQKLFGHEAAEDENFERLKEYYFKHKVYDRITSSSSLRILVAHKGVGKSALFKVAYNEDIENGILPVFLRPDDVIELGKNESEFLQLIRNWKEGLNEIIASRILEHVGIGTTNLSNLKIHGGKVFNFLKDTLKPYLDEKITLDPTKKSIIRSFLDSNTVSVYIDDLDRGWEGKEEGIRRISALLNAIRDVSNDNKEIRFRVALRSDVYFLVRTSDESTDKIESSVIWYSWTNHEILVLLIKRIETFFGRTINEQDLIEKKQVKIAHYLDSVFEKRFSGFGHWENAPVYRVLMSLIRKRPRDLVKLCTLAAKKAFDRKSNIIQTADLENVFFEYSQGRIQDTINEYRSELPDVERLIMGMRPNKKERQTSTGYCYSTAALISKIKQIIESGSFKFSNNKEATPKQLAQFLYKINFLTARKDTKSRIIRYYFEENRYLQSEFADFGFAWEVHPAYRWALQPENIMDIFKKLELTADDK